MKKIGYLPSLLLLITAFAFVQCDRDDHSACDVSNPLMLPWLNDTIAGIKNSNQDIVIHMGDYKGKKVFGFLFCCPACNTFRFEPPNYYDCNGAKVNNPDLSAFKYEKTIFRKDDSECQ